MYYFYPLFINKYSAYVPEELVDCQVSFDLLHNLKDYSMSFRGIILERSKMQNLSWADCTRRKYFITLLIDTNIYFSY